QPHLAGPTLAPLTAVAEAVRTAIEAVHGARTGDGPDGDAPDAAPRRASTSADDADHGAHEETLIGESAAWRYVVFRLEQVAATTATVLLLGGTGKGKELWAPAVNAGKP